MTTVIHLSLPEVKAVSKPWGQEKWLQASGGEHSYALKEITLNAGFKTSLQVHQFKAETNYILEGRGEMIYSPTWFDCERYVANGYTEQELQEIFDNLITIEYGPGSVMTIESGTIHRMVAIDQLRFVEASTPQLDDVIRLQDDANRTHGKIEAEHK
jgi:mannose-6-phosphate isomerase-like protein (cupin superfamily)